MKKNIAYSLCAMLLLSACSNDMKDVVDNASVPQSGLQYMEFTASTGTGTRTQLTSDNKVVWQAGDEISIFDGTGNRKFTTKEGGASAVFGGNAASADNYYALYPYQEGATLEGNVIKNVTLPSEQTAKAGSFDAAFNLSVASATSDLQLVFDNVGSLVKFAVSNEQAANVRKVKLTSNDDTAVLTGSVDITLGDQPTVTPVSGQQASATLIADNGLEAGKYYYFAVLPSELSTGFSLTFYDNEGKTWQKDYTKEANITPSSILKLSAIEIGSFTNSLLTNANLIAAAEASTGRTFTKNEDGSVSLLDDDNYQIAMAVTRLYVVEKGDPSVCEEIGVFSNLELLNCYGNGITVLNLSNNASLTTLYCDNNQLTDLELSNNASLTTLYCNNNQLTKLDLSNNTALTDLRCYNNQLTDLVLSNNASLTYLDCNNNLLTKLNLSNNTVLTEFHCDFNQLTRLILPITNTLTTLYCNNNQLATLSLSNTSALTTLNCSYNYFLSLDISYNYQIDCSTLKVGNQGDYKPLDLYVNVAQFSQPLPNSEENRDVNKVLNIRASFLTNGYLIRDAQRAAGRAFTKDANGRVSLLDDDNYQIVMAVTSLNVIDSSEVEEIGVFSNLEYLDCSSINISSLDISNNTALTGLRCEGNLLTSLDVSNNTALKELICYENQLTSLDLSKNTELTNLRCDDNQLTSLDLTNNTALTELICVSNQLTSLDLTKNTKLIELKCTSNWLTNLDISNNNQIDCSILKVGNQRNNQTLNLYVNADQLSQTLPTEENERVNILLKE
ncbi:MAG: hypothetical protein E7100_03580 [Bacteroidaceae bacterium]|nr:hypothetical protein [Bacteroidaceae bacterium]